MIGARSGEEKLRPLYFNGSQRLLECDMHWAFTITLFMRSFPQD